MNQLNALKVLIVEDHPFQREYVANCLNQIGIEKVITASDGAQALTNIERMKELGSNIDLIICDLQMPNMDGITFIRHLAEREYKGSLVILTAMDASLVASVTKMVKAYEINFIGSLIKPVNTKTLISFVTEVAEYKQLAVTLPLPEGVEEGELIEAIEQNGLIPYFQPLYDFSNQSLTGLEALARLRLPDGRILVPDDFLYLYTKLDKVIECEMQIYDQAFALAKDMLKLGRPIHVGINFCAYNLGESVFYDKLLDLSKKYAIPNDLITIEVTERSLINNMAQAIEFLARLRVNGFNLAVDDFGTGYSSIKQLELLPFNELKIDRSFIFGMENDKQKQAIVESTADLARRMGIKTVAEGIETQAAWDLAKDYGCSVCQGYLTGRPMSREDVFVLLDA